ncbi:unnamed protein product [Camellia sinensis]
MELINKTINLGCKGKLHLILVYEDHLGNSEETSSLVMEDCSSNVNFYRVVEVNPIEECCKRKRDEDEVATRYDLSGVVASLNEVAKRKELTQGYSEKEVDTMVEKTQCDVEFNRPSTVSVTEAMMEERAPCPKSNDKSKKCMEQVFTHGFFKSLSGPREGLRPGITLEVDLAQPLSEQFAQGPNEFQSIRPITNGLLLSTSLGPHTNIATNGLKILSQGQVKTPTITLSHLRNTRKLGEKKTQMEGFSRFARLYGHKASTISKHTSKFVIFRPAVAALAKSDLSEGYSISHGYLLKESKATV